MNPLSCAVFGCAPEPTAFWEHPCSALNHAVRQAIGQAVDTLHRRGVHTFYVNCERGAGLWAGEHAVAQMRILPAYAVRLFCVLPYEEQAADWPEVWRDRYFDLLEHSTYNVLASPHRTPDSYAEAHAYMLRAAGQVLLLDDPAHPDAVTAPIRRDAAALQRPITHVHLRTAAVTFP